MGKREMTSHATEILSTSLGQVSRQINAVLADLVDEKAHDAARQRLLEIIATATGYTYALLTEVEPDYQHIRVTAIYASPNIRAMVEKLAGFSLLGYRFPNDPEAVLSTPPTEVFSTLTTAPFSKTTLGCGR